MLKFLSQLKFQFLTFFNHQKKFKELENQIQYSFKKKGLLAQAFTHRSYVNEKHLHMKNYERLEFLGDTILQLIISEWLMETYPKASEGDLTKYRSALVSEKPLVNLAKKIQLGQYLLLGKGEEKNGGRERDSILADCIESMVAAIYLDSRKKYGFLKARTVVKHIFHDIFQNVQSLLKVFDFKSDLYEYLTQNKIGFIDYRVLKETGLDHEKEFTIGAFIDDKEYGIGIGLNKKNAEQEAAQKTLELLNMEQEAAQKTAELLTNQKLDAN